MNSFFLLSIDSNGVENDVIFRSLLDPLGVADGPNGTGGGGEAAVEEVVMVVVVGVGRRVVVHPGSLGAVGVEPCNYPHPCIQKLHVLSHLTFSPSKHPSLLFFYLSLSLSPNTPFSFLLFGTNKRKEKKGKKNPHQAPRPLFSLSPNSPPFFLGGERQERENKKKEEKRKGIYIRRRPKWKSPSNGRDIV